MRGGDGGREREREGWLLLRWRAVVFLVSVERGGEREGGERERAVDISAMVKRVMRGSALGGIVLGVTSSVDGIVVFITGRQAGVWGRGI